MKKMMIISIMAVMIITGNALALDMNQVQIHGFISQGYLQSSNYDFLYTKTKDGTFQFDEMGINFMTEPLDNLRLGIQFLSRDLGEIGNNEVKVDWAFGDYRFRNWLGIRAGLMKRPYGLYNQSRDIDSARNGILLPTSVYSEINREFYLSTQGIGIYGILPGNLSYEIQYGMIPLKTDDGIVKQADSLLGSKTESVHNDSVIAFMLRWDTPLSGLALGFTGFSLGKSVLETNIGEVNVTRYEEYISSLLYGFKDFTFSAEFRYRPMKMDLNGNITLVDNQILEAYHATAAYRFTGWFELGLGYAVMYGDKDDKDGERFIKIGQPAAKAWRKDLALSTRFDINDYWIFKLEGHYINGLDDVTSTLGNDPSADWLLFAAKVTFTF